MSLSPTSPDWVQIFKKENKDEDLVSLLLIEDYVGINNTLNQSDIIGTTILSPPYIGIDDDGKSVKSNMYAITDPLPEQNLQANNNIEDNNVVEQGIQFTKSEIEHIVNSLFEHKMSLDELELHLEDNFVLNENLPVETTSSIYRNNISSDVDISVLSLDSGPPIHNISASTRELRPNSYLPDADDFDLPNDTLIIMSQECEFKDITLTWWIEQLLQVDWMDEMVNICQDFQLFLQKNERSIRSVGLQVGLYVVIPVLLHCLVSLYSLAFAPLTRVTVNASTSAGRSLNFTMCNHGMSIHSSFRRSIICAAYTVDSLDYSKHNSSVSNFSDNNLNDNNKYVNMNQTDTEILVINNTNRAGTFSRLASQLFTQSKLLLCDSILSTSIHRQGNKFSQYCGISRHNSTDSESSTHAKRQSEINTVSMPHARQTRKLPLLPRPKSHYRRDNQQIDKIPSKKNQNNNQVQLWHTRDTCTASVDHSIMSHTSRFLTSTLQTFKVIFAYEKLLIENIHYFVQEALLVPSTQIIYDIQKAVIPFVHNPCVDQLFTCTYNCINIVGLSLSSLTQSTTSVTVNALKQVQIFIEQALLLLSPQAILESFTNVIEVEVVKMSILESLSAIEHTTLVVMKEVDEIFDSAIDFLKSASQQLLHQTTELWMSGKEVMTHVSEEVSRVHPVLDTYSVYMPVI